MLMPVKPKLHRSFNEVAPGGASQALHSEDADPETKYSASARTRLRKSGTVQTYMQKSCRIRRDTLCEPPSKSRLLGVRAKEPQPKMSPAAKQ